MKKRIVLQSMPLLLAIFLKMSQLRLLKKMKLDNLLNRFNQRKHKKSLKQRRQ